MWKTFVLNEKNINSGRIFAECYSFWCNVWLLNIGLNNGALVQAMELKIKVFLVQKMRHYDTTILLWLNSIFIEHSSAYHFVNISHMIYIYIYIYASHGLNELIPIATALELVKVRYDLQPVHSIYNQCIPSRFQWTIIVSLGLWKRDQWITYQVYIKNSLFSAITIPYGCGVLYCKAQGYKSSLFVCFRSNISRIVTI